MAAERPTLQPRPGFDWDRVHWHAKAEDEEHCSYCGLAIPEETVPLRLFDQQRDTAAVFCDECMVTWWGFEPRDVPLSERGFGTTDGPRGEPWDDYG
jgi:hypothetical protein